MAGFDAYMAMLNQTAAQVDLFMDHSGSLRHGTFSDGTRILFWKREQSHANINPYQYSGMNQKITWRQTAADLIRAQTRDFQTRHAPIEEMLANSITRTGTTYLAGDLERTNDAILGASANVQGMANRSADRLGVNGAQLDQNSTTSTLVGGLNETRQRDADRRLQLLTGGLSGITQGVRNIGS